MGNVATVWDQAANTAQQAAVSMNAARIIDAEASLEEALRELKTGLKNGWKISAEQAGEIARRNQFLVDTLTNSADLYAAWIHVFASATIGYNAQGDPAMPESHQINTRA